MRIKYFRGDIAELQVDVIARAASPKKTVELSGSSRGRHAFNLWHSFRKKKTILEKTEGIRAKYVIYILSPKYKSRRNQIISCVNEALTLAKKNGCKSIAFDWERCDSNLNYMGL